MKFRKLVLPLMLILLAQKQLNSGVIIGVDIPKEAAESVVEQQEKIKKQLEALSKETGRKYVFDGGEYSPHITVAFITEDKKTAQNYLEENGSAQEKLAQIASHSGPIDISNDMQHAKLDCWKGTPPPRTKIKCGENEAVKHYCNIVLKLADSKDLNKLAKELDEQFELKRLYPFSPHVTIGRVCSEDDQPIDGMVDQLKKRLVGIQASKQQQFAIESFKLKGEEKTEEEFIFGSKK